MIIEIAELKIAADQRAEFIQAINRAARDVLSQSPGYLSHAIYACQETPGRIVLKVEWATLEAHTVGFRQSPAFTQWREIIGPFFAQPPLVEHFDDVTAA